MAYLLSFSAQNCQSKRISLSATALGHNICLTVGIALLPVLDDQNRLKQILSSKILNSSYFSDISCTVSLNRNSFISEGCSDRVMLMSSKATVNSDDLIKVPAKIKYVFKNEKFARVLEKSFPAYSKWNFLDTSEKKDSIASDLKLSTDDIRSLLSYFVIIETCEPTRLTPLDAFKLSSDITVGTSISVTGKNSPRCCTYIFRLHLNIISGTPFADLCPSVFYNSISSGILCNKFGPEGELLLFDARCVPGCEGGTLYCETNSK